MDLPLTTKASAQPSISPQRVLGFRDLFLFYVVTGISLRWIAFAAAAGPRSIVIWAGAWLFFYVPLALSVVELSSRYPDEGGLYVWTRRAFGDFAGFICAWIYWTSYFPYLPAVLYFAAGNALYLRPNAWAHLSNHAPYYVVFSLITLLLALSLNFLGLRAERWLHNLGAIGMWAPVAIILAAALISWQRFGPATHFTADTMMPHLKDITFWAVLIFAFGGSETASYMGGEIRMSKRTVPAALLTAGITVAVCYILGTVSILVAMPAAEVSSLQGLMQAIAKTAGRIGWQAVVPWSALLITLSNLGAMSAFLAATVRLPFVAGVDRLLPSIFGKLHRRWRTPWFSLLVQGGIGAVFVLIGQAGSSVRAAYDLLVNIGVITYFIPYLFLFAAMFRLQREPAGPEVVRVPGGKNAARLLALIGAATAGFAVALSLFPPSEEPHKLLALIKVIGSTAALILFGGGIYCWGRRAASPEPQS
jgi:amino acid transporter